MRFLNKAEKDTAQINNISEETWLDYYKTLWYNRDEHFEIQQMDGIEHTDLITWEELNDVLKNNKNRKTPGPDNINSELLKYLSKRVKIRFLDILNFSGFKKRYHRNGNSPQ